MTLEEWLEEHHDPNWTPGPYGGRIVYRDARGRFTRKPAQETTTK